jgi:hypothetical protein
MSRTPLAIAALILTGALARAVPPAEEIEALLDFVETSGCELVRNGSAHDAAEGRRHLERKLAHLRARGHAATAEAFIEEAATRSSTTGRDYAVRCPAAPEQPSGGWLRSELERLRAAEAAP